MKSYYGAMLEATLVIGLLVRGETPEYITTVNKLQFFNLERIREFDKFIRSMV